MTATTTTATTTTTVTATALRRAVRARTGGPKDGPEILEHVAGWVLVVVLAILVTRLGLL